MYCGLAGIVKSLISTLWNPHTLSNENLEGFCSTLESWSAEFKYNHLYAYGTTPQCLYLLG